MPLVFVQRYVVGGAIAAGTGVQYVTGTLTLGNPTVVEFDSTLWASAVAGTAYTIFTYGTLSGSVASLQADAASLTALGFTSATFADTGSSITVTFS
jgi:hypothetical protein